MPENSSPWARALGEMVAELETAHWYMWTKDKAARDAIASAIASLQFAAERLSAAAPTGASANVTRDGLRVQALTDLLGLIASGETYFDAPAPEDAKKLLRSLMSSMPLDGLPAFKKSAHDFEGYRADMEQRGYTL